MLLDKKENFNKYGFVIIKGVFPEEKLETVRQLQEEIAEYADKGLEDPFQNWSIPHRNDQGVLYDLYQRHPEFQDMARNEEILDYIEYVIGKDIYLYDNSLIYKPKGKSNGVPWHQDFISRPEEPLKVIAWMALDDVTKENGALKFIPGSHKKGHLPWHRVKGETHHDRVNPEFVDKWQHDAIYAEMKAGDVLLFNMLLMHSSDEVHSDLPRRAFRCSYQSMESKVFTPRQSPIVLRGGAPKSLEKYYPNKKVIAKKSILKRGVAKIGRVLIRVSN